jgi:DNA-directed RNA polymerase subunit RPC12/RpoP
MVEHSPFARAWNPSSPAVTPEKECPRCGFETRTLTLLTWMTRYYICTTCSFRWSTSRKEELAPPTVSARRQP